MATITNLKKKALRTRPLPPANKFLGKTKSQAQVMKASFQHETQKHNSKQETTKQTCNQGQPSNQQKIINDIIFSTWLDFASLKSSCSGMLHSATIIPVTALKGHHNISQSCPIVPPCLLVKPIYKWYSDD